VVGRNLLEEGGFRIGDEQAEALLEVAGFGAAFVGGDLRAERTAL
jgi:hypothetical protein